MPHFDDELPGFYDAASDRALTNELEILADYPAPPTPTSSPAAEKSPTELAIDMLSANPPAWVTPEDIRKARRKARKDYREELKDAIAYELRKSINVDIKVIVENALTTIVKKVTDKVEAQLNQKGSGATQRIDNEVKRLVQESLRDRGVSMLAGYVQAEAQAYAKEMVTNNLIITLKEGNW